MKERKKIAVLCNYLLTSNRVGGMDRFFWLFDAKCKEVGHDIVWFFPNIERHGDYGKLKIIAPETSITLERFFLDYVKKEHLYFDVVITHFFEINTFFFKEVKAFYPSRTIAVDHNPRPLHGYSLLKQIQKKIKGLLYSRYTDVFAAVSDYSKNHLIKDFGYLVKKKIRIVHNGILCDTFEKNMNRAVIKPKFLVTSNLRYVKGVQDLIDAVSLLPDSIKEELKIDIYGEGDYEETLKSKIQELNLRAVFKFKGSSSQLNRVYCNYDYSIHPSYMETFCYTVVESLCSNVPVIATTYPGGNVLGIISEGENGFLFEPKNVKKLAQILEGVYLGTRIIRGSTSELIEREFTLEKMVQNHMALL